MRDNCTDYRQLFLNDVAMMDLRAPVEFTKGAFPNVSNLPLMNDLEPVSYTHLTLPTIYSV